MRVLILLSRCDQTGMTTNTLDLCEGLIDLGHDVTLIVGTKSDDDYVAKQRLGDFSNLGVKIVQFPVTESRIGRGFALMKILYNLASLKKDIIHVESPYLTFCPWLIRQKFTSTFHVNDLIRCFNYKNAPHLIAISKETKQYAMKNFGYSDKDITIVNHGVGKRFSIMADERLKTEIKEKHGLPKDKILIGLVGSIEKRKGHHILLNALKQLPPEDLDKAHVVFCGSSKFGNENRDWLYDTISSTIGWERVTHIEYCESKEIYDILDLTVLPSSLEGFPLVAIESMMSGVCTIRSNSEGASEQIVDGVTGRVFNIDDISGLSEILHELINNDELRQRLAKAGRDYALTHFTAKKMAENTVKVYEKVINEY